MAVFHVCLHGLDKIKIEADEFYYDMDCYTFYSYDQRSNDKRKRVASIPAPSVIFIIADGHQIFPEAYVPAQNTPLSTAGHPDGVEGA